ncbi:MAG: methyltransferase domain-containing protein [Ktedonobacteraceae bacterium]
MSTAPKKSEQTNTYFIDPENAAEMARLLKQDRFITREMGGVFPERSRLAGMQQILDLACGPGGWVLDLAEAHPQIQVVGIDISELMIAFARSRASSQGVPNARFQVMNALHLLDFPDHSFDLVNARLLVGFMPTRAWPSLLHECLRITRAGGSIRLTEGDTWGITTSPAIEQLRRLFSRALQVAGYSFSPDGQTAGITPVLRRLLHNAGYRTIQKTAHAIEYSYGTEAYEDFYLNFQVAFQLMQPFLITCGVTTQEEISLIYDQAMREMREEDFGGVWSFLTVTGEKEGSL